MRERDGEREQDRKISDEIRQRQKVLKGNTRPRTKTRQKIIKKGKLRDLIIRDINSKRWPGETGDNVSGSESFHYLSKGRVNLIL